MLVKNYRLQKQHAFHIYAAIVIIFTAWTIFYSLPKPSYFRFVLLIWIWRRYDFYYFNEKNKFMIFVLFTIIIFRAKLPLENGNPFFQIADIFLLSSMFIIPKKDLELIFRYIIKILLPILIIGLIQHIFIILGIHILPKYTDLYVNRDKGIYSIYFFNVYNLGESRFFSIFNEPGYLGTLIAFILVLKKYNLKNLKYFLFFISGIFTLSLNFFLLSIFYFFIILILSKKKLKIIPIFISVFIFIILIYKIFPGVFNELLYRFDYIPGVGLSDKRANLNYLIKYWDLLQSLNLKDFLLGVGRIESRTLFNLGHVGWVNLVSQIGILLTAILVLLILAPGIKNREILVFGFIFLLSIDSRPQIFRLLWMFFLALGISVENKYVKNS